MCLDRPDILKTQLRAILGPVLWNAKIMYPMVSGSEEVRRANAILNEAKQELKAEGISLTKTLRLV